MYLTWFLSNIHNEYSVQFCPFFLTNRNAVLIELFRKIVDVIILPFVPDMISEARRNKIPL